MYKLKELERKEKNYVLNIFFFFAFRFVVQKVYPAAPNKGKTKVYL